MGRLGAVLTIVAMAWAVGVQCAAAATAPAPPVLSPYQHDIDNLGVIARLQGRDILARDALSMVQTTPALASVFGEPGTDRGRKGLQELAMARVREDALIGLLHVFAPDCPTEATAEDVTAFYPFWRTALAREIENRVPPDHDDLSKVDPATPGVESIVRRDIRQWRLFHCAQVHYGAEAFQSWSLRSGYGLLPVELPGPDFSLEGPDMHVLTPSGSLYRMFREAEMAGLLSFPDDANRKAFFSPYRTGSSMSECFNDVGTAAAYFATPPWRSTAFPPKARPSGPLRYPWSGSPALLVDPPTGWNPCRNELGGLYLTSGDGLFIEYSIFTLKPSDQAVMDKLAPGVFRGAGFPSPNRTEAATILGSMGMAYTSSKIAEGKTVKLRVVVASLDPIHVILEAIATPADLTPDQQTALTRALSSVRLATP